MTNRLWGLWIPNLQSHRKWEYLVHVEHVFHIKQNTKWAFDFLQDWIEDVFGHALFMDEIMKEWTDWLIN